MNPGNSGNRGAESLHPQWSFLHHHTCTPSSLKKSFTSARTSFPLRARALHIFYVTHLFPNQAYHFYITHLFPHRAFLPRFSGRFLLQIAGFFYVYTRFFYVNARFSTPTARYFSMFHAFFSTNHTRLFLYSPHALFSRLYARIPSSSTCVFSTFSPAHFYIHRAQLLSLSP